MTIELNDLATAIAKVLILALWIALFGAWLESHTSHPTIAQAAVQERK